MNIEESTYTTNEKNKDEGSIQSFKDKFEDLIEHFNRIEIHSYINDLQKFRDTRNLIIKIEKVREMLFDKQNLLYGKSLDLEESESGCKFDPDDPDDVNIDVPDCCVESHGNS